MGQQAYRVVNNADIVARLPRSFGTINYDHAASTVLITVPTAEYAQEQPLIWVEGESNDDQCPVRDGTTLTSPMAQGALLGDLYNAVTNSYNETSKLYSSVTNRLQSFTLSDITSIIGINKDYTNRELKIIENFMTGKALAHHMEDEYYQAMGRACGFIALVGKEIQPIDSFPDKESLEELLSTVED